MDITVLSLAGATLTSVKAQPEWAVTVLANAVSEAQKELRFSVKLVFEGRVLEACQTIAEAGLFAGSLVHAVLMRGPQPGTYSGRQCSRDEHSYVRTCYWLTVSEDSTFVLERMVCSDVHWTLPDARLEGRIGPDGDFRFAAPGPGELALRAGPRGEVLLTAPFDEVDGDEISRCITLHRKV